MNVPFFPIQLWQEVPARNGDGGYLVPPQFVKAIKRVIFDRGHNERVRRARVARAGLRPLPLSLRAQYAQRRERRR